MKRQICSVFMEGSDKQTFSSPVTDNAVGQKSGHALHYINYWLE